MAVMVPNIGSISDSLFDMSLEDGDMERWHEIMQGAYCELDVVMYDGYALRVNRKNVDEEYDQYTRYIEFPEWFTPAEVFDVLLNCGWPLEGVRCKHSYDPCGQLYCDPIKLYPNERGWVVQQRVWRNV